MPARKNPDSEMNIRRIDTPPHAKKQTHGFQVHFSRGDSSWTKHFTDGVYGDKELAREAARRFRDQLAPMLPDSKDKVAYRDGAVGYVFRERPNKDGTITRYISASARDRKRHAVNRQFRIKDDDLQAAVNEALAWRRSVIEVRIRNEH
jgi:hypothetical protein